MWDLRKNKNFFPEMILPTKLCMHIYLSLSIGCWNIQENLDSDLF